MPVTSSSHNFTVPAFNVALEGPQGPPGPPGPASIVPGPPGPPGANGINGTNGTDGTNGTNGIDGVDGAAGPPGTTSWTGITDKPTTFAPDPEAVDDRVAALLVPGSNITLNYNDTANTLTIASTASGGGTGDVVGPASAVADRIAVFNGTTGRLIKDGGSTIAALSAYTPSGGIAANTFAGAIAELDTEKVAKAGDTVTGPLVLSVATDILTIATPATPASGRARLFAGTAKGLDAIGVDEHAWRAAGDHPRPRVLRKEQYRRDADQGHAGSTFQRRNRRHAADRQGAGRPDASQCALRRACHCRHRQYGDRRGDDRRRAGDGYSGVG